MRQHQKWINLSTNQRKTRKLYIKVWKLMWWIKCWTRAVTTLNSSSKRNQKKNLKSGYLNLDHFKVANIILNRVLPLLSFKWKILRNKTLNKNKCQGKISLFNKSKKNKSWFKNKKFHSHKKILMNRKKHSEKK